MECSNAIHSTAVLHFDKVYAYNQIYVWFISSTDMFLSMEQIYLRRRHVNANLIIDFSLMSDKAFAA